MSSNVTDWAIGKLIEQQLEIIDRTPEDYLVVRSEGEYTFNVAVLGVQNVVKLTDVEPLFFGAIKPQLVVNVPSKTLWSGSAIDHIHAASAAFGTLGDVTRAAYTKNAGTYRDKDMGFFINAMEQHTNVSGVSYVYDRVFKVDQRSGTGLIVAVIETYNMSAEDVRNAKNKFGHFDVVVKSSGYGSITDQAEAAAKSIGAQALTFRQLMGRLSK
jgi:hypothetical protein